MEWTKLLTRLLGRLVQNPEPHRPRTKLAREDVLRLIEENGGPEGLNLAGQDLSWVDLGREVISQEAEMAWRAQGERPTWQNQRAGGINLSGANLANADLFGANLAFAD